jgi:hypothetical protein
MTDLSQLTERVEAATGPDRELDHAIHYHMVVVKSDCFTEQSWIRKATADNWNTARYTTSIDAALTLLPEGYAVTNMMIWPGERASLRILGTMLRPFGKDRRMSWVHAAGDGRWDGDGATPALALLSAILKARQTAAQPAKQAEAR